MMVMPKKESPQWLVLPPCEYYCILSALTKIESFVDTSWSLLYWIKHLNGHMKDNIE
jgi:hypothetical protein